VDIVVEDSVEGLICKDFDLNPGESKICIKEGIAKAGEYENRGVVIGKDINGKEVRDEDLSHYYGKSIEACLGDYVWEDKNANGVQEEGESGIAGAKVELFDSAGNRVKDMYGNEVAPQVTAEDGRYKFCNLDAGEYIVRVTPPEGYEISPRDVGGDDSKDSDIDPQTGETTTIRLEEGEEDLRWDAGVYKKACLGDYVWEDVNGNGIQDEGEVGIEGAKVYLLDEGGNVLAETTTDGSGNYKFCELMPGNYIIR